MISPEHWRPLNKRQGLDWRFDPVSDVEQTVFPGDVGFITTSDNKDHFHHLGNVSQFLGGFGVEDIAYNFEEVSHRVFR